MLHFFSLNPLEKDLMEMNPGRVESLTPARFRRRVTECEMWLHSPDWEIALLWIHASLLT